jgi:CBS domain-containing protein
MLTIRDVMSRPALTVHPETPIKDVARLLVEHRISGLPVVDADGRVLGVISEADLLLKEQGPDTIPHRHFARLLGESPASRAQRARLEATTAGEAMSAPAVTVTGDRPVAEAAALMTSRGINRLPVVEDGVLVGVVSRADLIRAYVRSDDELAEVIRRDVLLGTMWLDPILFKITVQNGIAGISGAVGRRSTAEVIERMVAMIPGIIDVVADIHWETDDRDLVAPGRDLISPWNLGS